MADPISDDQSCSPEVDERACTGETNSSGGTYEKLEELQIVVEVEEHQFAKLLEANTEQLERLKTRNEELEKQVAVKMVELKEVENQIVKKEEDLQVLWDQYKQALVTHYFEEMANRRSSGQGDALESGLLEMTNSSSYSGQINVLSDGLGLEGEGIEHHLILEEEFDEEEVSKTLKVRKDLFILGDVDAGGDRLEGGVQLRGSSHADLRSSRIIIDGEAPKLAKVRCNLFPEDIAVAKGGEFGAQAEEDQVGGKVEGFLIEHEEVLGREAMASPTGTGEMEDQNSDSYIEAGSDEDDGDNPVHTQDLLQILE